MRLANPDFGGAIFVCTTQSNGAQTFVGFVGGVLTVDVAKNISGVALLRRQFRPLRRRLTAPRKELRVGHGEQAWLEVPRGLW